MSLKAMWSGRLDVGRHVPSSEGSRCSFDLFREHLLRVTEANKMPVNAFLGLSPTHTTTRVPPTESLCDVKVWHVSNALLRGDHCPHITNEETGSERPGQLLKDTQQRCGGSKHMATFPL